MFSSRCPIVNIRKEKTALNVRRSQFTLHERGATIAVDAVTGKIIGGKILLHLFSPRANSGRSGFEAVAEASDEA